MKARLKSLPFATQLALLPSLLGVFVLLVAIGAMVAASRDNTLADTATRLAHIGRVQALALNRLLLERVRVVETLARDEKFSALLATDPNQLAALAAPARAATMQTMEAAWRAASVNSAAVVAARLDNPMATLLRDHADALPETYGELFVTDRFGALVASTGKLTNLAHAHKYWWRAAYADGAGRVFLDDRGFDASAGETVLGVVVPIRGPEGIIGILKANVLVRDLLNTVIDAVDPRAYQIAVARSGGSVLIEQGVEPLTATAPEQDRSLVASRDPITQIQDSDGTTVVAAANPVPLTLGRGPVGFGGEDSAPDHHGGNRGEHWSVLVRRWVRTQDIIGMPIARLAAIAGGVLLVVVAFAVWLARRLTRPIDQLVGALDAFQAGSETPHLPVSGPAELVRLGRAFNAMAKRNQSQAASIERLNAEIAQREAVERRIREANWELGNLKAELERSNHELEQFAYVASHDLQEPVRTVVSYLQLIERRYAKLLDDDGRELFAFALDGGQRMRQLIEDLLALSRVRTQARPSEPVDLNALIEELRADFATALTELGGEIVATPLPTVLADPAQARQLLSNLLANALRYHADSPPRITIDATREADADATQPERWIIAVRDNGIGIDPKFFERIFVIFQRLHGRGDYPGTGIGLAMCKRIVERHGGRIWVESTPGVGSSFFFTLPGAPAGVAV